MPSEMPHARAQMFDLCTDNGWEIIDHNVTWSVNPYRYAIRMWVLVDGDVGILATDWGSDTITLESICIDTFDGRTFEKARVSDE